MTSDEVRCSECGRAASAGERFCRDCGGEFAAAVSIPAAPAPGVDAVRPPAPGWRDSRLFIALFLVLAFAFFTHVRMPGSTADKRNEALERKNACVADMRRIKAAAERLFRDKGGAGATADLKTLVVEGYLPAEPHCPATGNYMVKVSYVADPAATERFKIDVFCSVHQGIDGGGGL